MDTSNIITINTSEHPRGQQHGVLYLGIHTTVDADSNE